MTKSIVIGLNANLLYGNIRDKKVAHLVKVSSPSSYKSLQTKLDAVLQNLSTAKLILSFHGNEEGNLRFFDGDAGSIHPTELLKIVKPGQNLLCDIFACHTGSNIRLNAEGALETKESALPYEQIPQNVSLIIHSGKSTSASIINDKQLTQTAGETNEARLFLEGIIAFPETMKFLTKKDGQLKYYKYSAPKPTGPQDISNAEIEKFLKQEVTRFVNFYQSEIGAIDPAIVQEYHDRITPDSIESYKARAFVIEIMRIAEMPERRQKPYAAFYLQAGLNLASNIGEEMRNSDAYLLAFFQAITHGYKLEVKNFLKNYPDIHQVNFNGETVLHTATALGLDDVVIELLQRGADINAQDNTGKTALTKAVVLENETIIKILLKAGCKIADNIKLNIPLSEACEAGYKNAVEAILVKSEVFSEVEFNECLKISKTNNHPEITAILLQKFLQQTVGNIDQNTVTKISDLLKNPEVNLEQKFLKSESSLGEILLSCAADKGSIYAAELIKFLLENGAQDSSQGGILYNCYQKCRINSKAQQPSAYLENFDALLKGNHGDILKGSFIDAAAGEYEDEIINLPPINHLSLLKKELIYFRRQHKEVLKTLIKNLFDFEALPGCNKESLIETNMQLVRDSLQEHPKALELFNHYAERFFIAPKLELSMSAASQLKPEKDPLVRE